MIKPGDTIIEVLLATVVLSIVLAGAFNLSNKAIQNGQAALERTEAVNIVRDYAESLQFIHSAETDGADAAWKAILAEADNNTSSYSGAEYCNVTPTANPIYLKLDELNNDPIDDSALVKDFNIPESGGRLLYADAIDNNADDLFAVWLEVYDPKPGANSVVDIHIRTCWDSIAEDNADRVGAVLRLTEARDK